jgi:site-specific DNA-methyltransferase (adenine-specific)
VFAPLHRLYHFTIDAAASAVNSRLPRYWTKEKNGLLQDWTGERVWVNPPFGARELDAWTNKARLAVLTGCELVVMIVPVKSDQAWWHTSAMSATEIQFIRGRVTFGGASASYPGPCAILMWHQWLPGPARIRTFEQEGRK